MCIFLKNDDWMVEAGSWANMKYSRILTVLG